MLADKVPGTCHSPAWSSPEPEGSDEEEGRASEAPSLPVTEERHRKQRGPGRQPSLLTYTELTYAGLWLVFLGSMLRKRKKPASEIQR